MPAERVLAAIARGYDAPLDDGAFGELALAVHAYQRAHSAVIGRLTPAMPKHWAEIPLVPTRLFAAHAIAAFPAAQATRVFESSGTTGEQRSKHFFRDLSLYRAASLAGARWALGPGPFRVRSLFAHAENSSLACMIAWLKELHAGAPADAPELVIGTAYNYVEALDRGELRPLAPGSLVIETGGYKGRTRAVAKAELYAQLSAALAIPQESILAEYGMCELSSPLWEKPGEPRGFRPAGWMRVRLVDAETLRDSERGLIALYDPANLDSSVGILTGDVGVLLAGGRIGLEGRLAGVEPRGCSRIGG